MKKQCAISLTAQLERQILIFATTSGKLSAFDAGENCVNYRSVSSERRRNNRWEEKMKKAAQILFWLGILSIPLSWLMWYIGPEIEIGRQIMNDVADPALRAALEEAHAERWGLFVGLWPVTLLVLSYILERKA